MLADLPTSPAPPPNFAGTNQNFHDLSGSVHRYPLTLVLNLICVLDTPALILRIC